MRIGKRLATRAGRSLPIRICRMIVVHYLENSRAHRILWLLEELGLSYEVVEYRRGADMRAPKSLKAIHPLGKSPVIVDDDTVIAESGAIIEYVLDTYGGDFLRPEAGTEARRRYTYFLHYAEGSAMPLLVMKVVFSKLPGQVPFLIRPFASLISAAAAKRFIDPQLKDHVALWETTLASGGYFAGTAFSAADIAMSFPVEAAMSGAQAGEAGSDAGIRRFLDVIRARPAYQRALARGGAYSYASS